TEEQALNALATSRNTDLLIQDLGRPIGKVDLKPLAPPYSDGYLEDAGWRFYNQYLRLEYPEVPVLIYSAAGPSFANWLTAREYNLRILGKSDYDSKELLATVAEMLGVVTVVHEATATPPAIVSLDFEQVNSILLRHLARQPADLHRV